MTVTTPQSRLSDQVLIAGQLQPQDVGQLVEAGIVVVVNHRPDGEDVGQAASVSLEQAADRAGLRYVHIPVTGLPGPSAVQATRDVLDSLAPGERALFFCRSGMRSTAAWALAERLKGVDADALRAAARKAGYDLDRLPL